MEAFQLYSSDLSRPIFLTNSRSRSSSLKVQTPSLICLTAASPCLCLIPQCTSRPGYVSSSSSGMEGTGSKVLCVNSLQVVLVSPQIPGTAGCVARTCAASAIGLHLIEPLGFQGGEKRLLAFTKRGMEIHSDFSYKRGDWLIFGSETSGLPPEVLFDCNNKMFGGKTVRIPMVETYVECLNLAVSVGIAVYEASRQLNYEQLHCHSEACIDSKNSLAPEDMFT